MTTPPRLQYANIRTRVVDGQVLIGLRHTAKAADGAQVKHDWIEMTPEDAAGLVEKLREVLGGEILRKAGGGSSRRECCPTLEYSKRPTAYPQIPAIDCNRDGRLSFGSDRSECRPP